MNKITNINLIFQILKKKNTFIEDTYPLDPSGYLNAKPFGISQII